MIEELKTGLLNIGGGTLYDIDEDVFIDLLPKILGNILEGGKYKNPIEKALKEEKNNEKNRKWLIEKGPQEMAKLVKERNFIDGIIRRLNVDLINNGIKYNLNYDRALEIMAPYRPYIEAAKKMHMDKYIKNNVSAQSANNYVEYLNDENRYYDDVKNPFINLPAPKQQFLLEEPNIKVKKDEEPEYESSEGEEEEEEEEEKKEGRKAKIVKIEEDTGIHRVLDKSSIKKYNFIAYRGRKLIKNQAINDKGIGLFFSKKKGKDRTPSTYEPVILGEGDLPGIVELMLKGRKPLIAEDYATSIEELKKKYKKV